MSTTTDTRSTEAKDSNSSNGTTGGSPQRRRAGRKIEEVIEAPLQSADVPIGQYPALFVGFGETTIWLPTKFRKGKDGHDALVEKMAALFATRVGDQVRILQSLVSPPTGAGLSSMSNLHKFLKVLGAGDATLWDGSIDNVKRGAKLSQFTGKTTMVMVGKDKKGFARAEKLVMAPEGVAIPFPTPEEAQAALEIFQHSGEIDNVPESDEDVPF